MYDALYLWLQYGTYISYIKERTLETSRDHNFRRAINSFSPMLFGRYPQTWLINFRTSPLRF